MASCSSSHFSSVTYTQSRFSQTLTFTSLASPLPLSITNVYAPTDHSLKPSFLADLSASAPPPNLPWMICGDFNLMRYASDKNNDSFRQPEANLFNQWINNSALIELPLLDRKFTWSNKRDRPTLELLDRVFVNDSWDQIFPDSSVSSLTRFVSDHVPLVISVCSSFPPPALFRFELGWAQNPACRTVIASSWDTAPTRQSAPLSITRALKKCRLALRVWRRNTIPINARESNCKLVIDLLDHIEESRFLSFVELALRRTVIKVLHRTVREKLIYWRLRSKIKTTIQGDENSRYFHASASSVVGITKFIPYHRITKPSRPMTQKVTFSRPITLPF